MSLSRLERKREDVSHLTFGSEIGFGGGLGVSLLVDSYKAQAGKSK